MHSKDVYKNLFFFLFQQTTSTFVDAWRVQNACDNEVSNDEGLELVCTDEIKSAAKEMCNKLLSNDKFSDCLAVNWNRLNALEKYYVGLL